MPIKHITPKQQKVCEYYLKGMSMRQALLQSGYSDSYATHMAVKFLHSRAICEYLRKRQEEIAKASTIDITYVYRELSKIIDRPGEETKDKVAALKVLKEALNETLALTAKIEVAQSSSKESEQTPIVINVGILEKPKDA